MNFTKPYYKNIPKILQNYISDNDMKHFYMKNILYNYLNDNEYFYSHNSFHLKSLKIGPFVSARDYDVKMSSTVKNKLIFPYAEKKIERKSGQNYFYYYMNFNSQENINYDIKLEVSAFKFNFYTWVNLWYNTIENLSNYILNNDIINLCGNNSFEISKTYYNLGQRKSNVSITEVMKQIEEISSTQATNNENENEIDLDDNDKLNDDEIDTNSKNKSRMSNISISKRNIIGKLIYNFSNEKDLNNFISGVNDIAEKKGIKPFDYNNLEIKLELKELDKFQDWFSSIGNKFRIEFIYSLVSQNKKEEEDNI